MAEEKEAAKPEEVDAEQQEAQEDSTPAPEPEAEEKPKRGRPSVRKSAKSKDEAGEEGPEKPAVQPEEEVEELNKLRSEADVRIVKEGEEYEVATTEVGPNKVATETVLQEYVPANSKRPQYRLIARAGAIVK